MILFKQGSNIIDGKAIAAEYKAKIAEKILLLASKHRLTPGLAVILVGNDAASEIYINNKVRYAKEVGIHSFEFRMPAETHQKSLIAKIEHLNNDPKIHGILVQLPLPEHIDTNAVINAVSPHKDVDGFNVINVGKLVTNQEGFVPCTPLGCLRLLKMICPDLAGKKAVIIGRSNIVGKPMASLLLNENCTVTIIHSKSQHVKDEAAMADILVTATGKPNFITKEFIKPGAIVIDVGINRITLEDGSTRLIGDVKFDEVKDIASAITPVPGGVGPMTISCLLENTLKAACKVRNIEL
jgi:methylenetetrahydrofolate dehydrogenase (NADP+)/methenyltetrahydrofolate cyclohydrolase